ncbi:FliM/FliN family flagellar motor C-terminal domain-containing protein [Legionella bononiensis]|uniref:FliM/FliN family flagellar motor switch protein n=1 Tax=Legionella bononiensis TaxID=2793102 RepID=A0ABS1WD43_9GAMM|nr:FliM/FliN family flagellar motor C-terminal domain-containing protein [Legionella bononiensis]MBL7479145.1 FliM/FliN family flagellar motor switch protein [Legionella bononiensis]MBL7527278.1 FliM/FliN family flagellar motor switch protein [Legionella bononiensis]MBL7562247.1 FliM/FliN family flagellar motor switch protein [Legionella bononiensis]
MIKPYRLINAFELQELSRQCLRALESWNSLYTLHPVTMDLHVPPKEYSPGEGYSIKENESTLACIETHYLTVLNQALFGKDTPCFNSVSQELFTVFIHQLLKVNECAIDSETCSTHGWFYRGSTSLLLRISCCTTEFTIILHPNWVYQNLPQPNNKGTQTVSLDEALADQRLALNLELYPLTLPLHQLITLSVGDVIATDHPISASMSLTQNHQLVARADLGQSDHFKSIILKGSS